MEEFLYNKHNTWMLGNMKLIFPVKQDIYTEIDLSDLNVNTWMRTEIYLNKRSVLRRQYCQYG